MLCFGKFFEMKAICHLPFVAILAFLAIFTAPSPKSKCFFTSTISIYDGLENSGIMAIFLPNSCIPDL